MTDATTTPAEAGSEPQSTPLRDYLIGRHDRPATPTAPAPTTDRIFDAAFEENIVGSLIASKSLREGVFSSDPTPMTSVSSTSSKTPVLTLR